MGDWYMDYDGQLWTNSGAPVTVDPGAVVNTKGTWAELEGSTEHDVHGVSIHIGTFNQSTVFLREYLVDIGIGAAASEQILIPDLRYTKPHGGERFAYSYFFPIQIPAGTRVAARCQADQTSTREISVSARFLHSGWHGQPCGQIEAAGATVSGSTGTPITIGTSNAEGAYAQLTAATTHTWKGFWVAAGCDNDASQGADEMSFDIAVGAASSEQNIIEDVVFYPNQNEECGISPLFVPLTVPAGSRVSARASMQGGTANGWDLMVWGLC